MKVAIIGHGPSLLKHRLGKEIDKQIVVRLKRSWMLPADYPETYGSRTDYVCGSATLGPALCQTWTPKQYWIFLDTRHEHLDEADVHGFMPHDTHVDKQLCDEWVKRYRKIRRTPFLHKQQKPKGHLSDRHGHKHPSAGTFAILYALNYLQPDTVNLYGFDSLLEGRFDWSVTRGPEYDEYPDHNWETESRLVNDICTEHGYTLDRERCSINTLPR